MAAAEAVPFNRKPRVGQPVSEFFCRNIRQDLVLHSMALKDRQPFAFLEQWIPFLCSEERAGQLDQPGIRLSRFEHHITRKHGALGKSPEDGLTRVSVEVLFDLFEEDQHRLARRSQAFGNLLREIADPACRLIRGNARHVDNPPGARIPWAETQRERAFRKNKPRAGWHIQDIGQRHKIVPRRAETVQEQDERAATSTLSICTARDPRPQTANLFSRMSDPLSHI